jgi:hypothetical protein
MRRLLARGQTMVLFALCLLLMALMVTLTLSMGMKVREKMEVQAVADAAAYSNAALTARVYNEIAVMNRAQIGHMVSMAGVQSLISWSSSYRANATAIFLNYGVITLRYAALAAKCCKTFSSCPWRCPCALVATAQSGLSSIQVLTKLLNKFKKFDKLDKEAAKQVANLQGAASRLYAAQIFEYFRLMDRLNNQGLAKEIVQDAAAGSAFPGELKAPSRGDAVTNRETGPFVGAVFPINLINGHHLYAGMGSRGFTFVTSRGGMATPVLNEQLKQNFMPSRRDTLRVVNQGSAYFADSMNHGGYLPSGAFSWADDHGINYVKFERALPLCPKYDSTLPAFNTLKSTDADDSSDTHMYFPSLGWDQDPPQERHTLGPCLRCPGIWPTFVDYSPVRVIQSSDNWGQPKNYAVIQRDYRVRGKGDPWNLSFNFDFAGQAPTSFDNRGLVLADGTDISKQTALSAGIAYYHRKGHWKEPPNLLNPYWRATLVPLTVDAQGRGSDVGDTLRDVDAPWAADAWQELRNQGYRGGP